MTNLLPIYELMNFMNFKRSFSPIVFVFVAGLFFTKTIYFLDFWASKFISSFNIFFGKYFITNLINKLLKTIYICELMNIWVSTWRLFPFLASGNKEVMWMQ
jgi:hypothetical protein